MLARELRHLTSSLILQSVHQLAGEGKGTIPIVPVLQSQYPSPTHRVNNSFTNSFYRRLVRFHSYFGYLSLLCHFFFFCTVDKFDFYGRLCSRCGHYIFALWFLLLSFFFFSSPNLSGRRVDVYHTLHMVWP